MSRTAAVANVTEDLGHPSDLLIQGHTSQAPSTLQAIKIVAEMAERW